METIYSTYEPEMNGDIGYDERGNRKEEEEGKKLIRREWKRKR